MVLSVGSNPPVPTSFFRALTAYAVGAFFLSVFDSKHNIKDILLKRFTQHIV